MADDPNLRVFSTGHQSNQADRIHELEVENTSLLDLLRDVRNSGVVLDDARLGYLEVQIDRPTWDEIREVVDG